MTIKGAQCCVEQVRGSVSAANYQAFRMLLFEECTVKQVWPRLGMSPNQVYKAKARVLEHLCLKHAELDPDLNA